MCGEMGLVLEVRKTYADAANRGLRRSPARAGALPRLIARLSARARFAVLGFGSNGSWPRRVGVAAAGGHNLVLEGLLAKLKAWVWDLHAS